ncbi:MAG: WYL domain-containing protein [Ruminococcus sp.]|nr:WYL domain-containing protein [Ruminococcus sp.]
MRDFYVYGFKSRGEYNTKSSRSYDDERRRMESWLGDHMSFVRSKDGKNMFISIDSRVISHNPLYRAWKTKSFTDRDVTLHFILFDILHTPDIALTLSELLTEIDTYLADFDEPLALDESTVRKKLKEYTAEGIIIAEKQGRSVAYRRAGDTFCVKDTDAIHYFSEVLPCGVIGSYILDKQPEHPDRLYFKHHYITSALDSDVLCTLFDAIRRRCFVTLNSFTRYSSDSSVLKLVPLKIYISAQSGRQHLLAYDTRLKYIKAFRIDSLSDVQIEDTCQEYGELRAKLDSLSEHMWGVNCNKSERLSRVDFTVRIDPDEDYIVRRLYREKRIGTVEKLDESHYRFYADVYDTSELIPWIRTFICRITQLSFSDRTTENLFKKDIEAMYKLYSVGGEQS